MVETRIANEIVVTALHERGRCGCERARPVGHAMLVGDYANLVALRCKPAHRHEKILSVPAVDPARAERQRGCAGARNSLLARKLARTVHVDRANRRVLSIRRRSEEHTSE